MQLLARGPAFDGGVWLKADGPGSDADRATWSLEVREQERIAWLWFDILLDSAVFVTFQALLCRGDTPVQRMQFSPLTQCQTRVVFALSAGLVQGVNAVAVRVMRKTVPHVRFCVGPMHLSAQPPPRLESPALPVGPLLDAFGQSTLHSWAGRTRSEAELVQRLERQSREADDQRRPASFNQWGGWTERHVPPTGFFRTHHDGARWWLVDPEGSLFWSSGVDCVHPTIDHEVRYETRWMNLRTALSWLPEADGPMGHCLGQNPWHHVDDREVNYTIANFTRAFGRAHWYAHWQRVTTAQLRRIGFNTAGNWSDTPAMSRNRVSYVRPLELGLKFNHTPLLAKNLPDMFDDGLAIDLAQYARQLESTVDDPAMIGYFLHNEPAWHFDDASPAEAMLAQSPPGAARRALARWLRERHINDDALSAAWQMPATFAQIESGQWQGGFTAAARHDLTQFSAVMIERLCQAMSAACRAVDPNHLNLGLRWWTFPPVWALQGMGSFDVVSFDCYKPRMHISHFGINQHEPGIESLAASLGRPFLVGEWHFGALGAGLPSAGLYRARDQRHRGRAFRNYLEHAAAEPWCVGAHWFNLYDRTAAYCAMSNENYNIGFMDICNREHAQLTRAAQASHERLYDVAAGRVPPYDEPPEFAFPSR